jgi:hypothetical protein
LAEFEQLSPIDRMLMRQGFQAVVRIAELEKRLGGTMADLQKHLGVAAAAKPEAVSAPGKVVTGQPPAPLDEDEWML